MVSEIRTVTAASFFLAALLSTSQLSATSEPPGQDWYCSDPEGHKQYAKHLKHHLNHSGEAIADRLDRIYNDPDLLPEEKRKRALKVLDNYLMKMKAGVGD